MDHPILHQKVRPLQAATFLAAGAVCLLVIAALAIARFFDSDLGFVTRGLGFIVVGAGFLVANVIFFKKRVTT